MWCTYTKREGHGSSKQLQTYFIIVYPKLIVGKSYFVMLPLLNLEPITTQGTNVPMASGD